jgi:predicted HNH restriction endonuclease
MPLSQAESPRKTTLDDLAVVCANCHRAIHSTSRVEENFAALKKMFAE